MVGLDSSKEELLKRIGELERHAAEVGLLNEMGDFLQSCSRNEEAYAVIQEWGKQLFPNDSGALYILQDPKNLAESATFWGERPGADIFSPDSCWALRRGKPHIMVAGASVVVCEHVGQVLGECICIPLIAHGEALGVIQLRTGGSGEDAGKIGKPGRLTHGRELAVSFAERIALALANLRLKESLRTASIRDALTGLYNRRYLEETLERELLRAGRKETSVGVIMCDLDGFKAVNDRFGHPAGDEVLRKLGHLLRSHVRDEDIACRYGGDEFALILPDAAFEIVLERSNRLCAIVQEIAVAWGEQGSLPVSLSFGVAAFPQHGISPTKLIGAADSALYRAKTEGRSRVVGAKSLNGRGEPHGSRKAPSHDSPDWDTQTDPAEAFQESRAVAGPGL